MRLYTSLVQHVITARMSHDSLFSIALDDGNKDKNRDSNNVPCEPHTHTPSQCTHPPTHTHTYTHPTHTHTVDNNHVVLDAPSSGEGYINASFITGYYNRIEFIATQHPLPSTIADFWSMIWERSIKTIVTIGPLADPQVGCCSCVCVCVCVCSVLQVLCS